MFMDYKGKLSAIDLVTSLNSIRRSDSPAAKAEIAKRIMEFLRDGDEEAKVEELLKGEDKLTADKIRIVREKKKRMTAAEMAGTTPEKMKQRDLIEKIADKDPYIAELWKKAKKKKISVDKVYSEAVKRQEEKAQKTEESEAMSEKNVLKDTRPVLVQINEKLRSENKNVREESMEWRGKYYNLKAAYEILEQKHKNLKNVFKTAFESAGIEIKSSKKENVFPKPKELREAGLKY